MSEPIVGRGDKFCETRWTMVLKAARSDSAEASAAIEYLYHRYREPLLAFLRGKGQTPEQAEDLLHSFFERLISHDTLSHAAREKGKLRTFLCNSMRNMMVDQWRKSARQRTVSLGTREMEEQRMEVSANSGSPDREFDRAWAAHVLENGVKRLREEYSLRGRLEEFECFRPYLTQKRMDTLQAEAAIKLNVSEDAFKKAVSRLRQKYRAAIESEIADTLAEPTVEALEEEKEALFAALGGEAR